MRTYCIAQGFPGSSVVKNLPDNAVVERDKGSETWVGKIPWSRKWQHAPVMPGKFHGQRSLVDYSPWGHKELDMTERTHTHTQTLHCTSNSYYSVLCGDLNGKETQKGGYVCMYN